jgi:hypothetical protein
MKGWECPVCGGGVAPGVTRCPCKSTEAAPWRLVPAPQIIPQPIYVEPIYVPPARHPDLGPIEWWSERGPLRVTCETWS